MKIRALSILAAALGISSCQMHEVESTTGLHNGFHGHIEGFIDTRTSLDQNNNILWSKSDQLLIFNGTTLGSIYEVDKNSIGETSASFNYVGAVSSGFVAGTDVDHNIAVYPMNTDIKCLKADSSEPTKAYMLRNIELTNEQAYSEGSFSQGSFPMVAVTKSVEDKELKFRNVLGCLKLQLLGESTVKSITISGNNNEPLAGTSNVTAYTNSAAPTIEIVSDAETTLTMDCGDNGVTLNMETPEVFIFSLPPTDFSKGFTITVTDSDGKESTISTQKQNIVKRSTILKMPAVFVGDITEDYLVASQPEMKFNSEGGEFEIEVMTNLEYEIIMPQVDWLKMEESTGLFKVSENNTNETRNTEIIFKALNSEKQAVVTVIQYSGDVINFADEFMEICCVSAFDTNNDGKLSFAEAAAVKSLNDMDVSVLYDRETSFDEFQYFTSVKILPKYYFEGIYLRSITLPESLRLIGACAFEGGFEVININDINTWLNIEFSKDEPVMAFGGTLHLNGAPLTDVIIPEGTERIQDYLFCGFLDLKSVTLPSSVKYIDEGAFAESGLEIINIPEGVTFIGDYAFDCTELNEIVLPSSVTYLGVGAFRSSEIRKAAIPEGITNIPRALFRSCDQLQEIVISSTVESIEEGAFGRCTNLKKVHISDLEAWCRIHFESSFDFDQWDYYCSNPLYHGGSLFLNGVELTELNIPESITEIKAEAFTNAIHLTKITIPSTVEKIGDRAFYSCTGLKEVIFSEGLQEIGNYAFYSCNNMKTTLPNSLAKVGDYAFCNCYRMLPTTGINTEVGKNAFEGCFGMSELPEAVTDPDPSNIDFVHRVLVTEFVGCGYDNNLVKTVKEAAKDDIWKDKFIVAASHTYDYNDPAYLVSGPRHSQYPYATIDMLYGFDHMNGIDNFTESLDAAYVRNIARAGISVNSVMENNTLVINTQIKASEDARYLVGAWLLEDNIYWVSPDYLNIKESDPDYNYDMHHDCLRIADSRYEGGWSGHDLGMIMQGETKQKTFCMHIDDSWKQEDLHFIVFVSTEYEGRLTVCNVIDCRPNAAIPFEYIQN